MRLTDVKKVLPATFYGAGLMVDADYGFKKRHRTWFYMWEDAVELCVFCQPRGCAIEIALAYDLNHLPHALPVRRGPVKDVSSLRALINEVWFEFRDNLRLSEPRKDPLAMAGRLEALSRFLAIPDEYPTFWERLG